MITSKKKILPFDCDRMESTRFEHLSTNFKGDILKFVAPFENSVFLCNNPDGIQLLTRLRLGLSHLPEYKFKHNFQHL